MSLFILLSIFLTRLIPFSSLFRNVNTLIHEFGHALVTLLVSGKVLSIELFSNHSGVTYSAVPSSNNWAFIAVSLGGYTIASLFAWLMFAWYRRGWQVWGIACMLVVSTISLVLYVRGTFGVTWLIGFIVLNVIMLFLNERIRNLYYLLLAFITLEEALLTPFVLVNIAFRSPTQAGDAANLARYTGIPSMVWAVFFVIFALWCAKASIQALLQKQRQTAREQAEYTTTHSEHHY